MKNGSFGYKSFSDIKLVFKNSNEFFRSKNVSEKTFVFNLLPCQCHLNKVYC